VPLLVLHLRWNDVDAERYALLRWTLAEHGGRPPGCLSRRHVRHTRSVMVYEVWDDGPAAERELARVRAVLGAGRDEPQRVVFTLPDLFAPGFRRPPARRRPTVPGAAVPAAVVPAPRSAEPAAVGVPAP
jgi:hypothetical protein